MAKVKLHDERSGSYMFRCPAGHFHYINTKIPNGQKAKWTFNGNFEFPTFTPSVNEKTGYFVDPETKGDEDWLRDNSYHCHFIITDGKIHFCADCSHGLAGQTVELPEME